MDLSQFISSHSPQNIKLFWSHVARLLLVKEEYTTPGSHVVARALTITISLLIIISNIDSETIEIVNLLVLNIYQCIY